MLILVALFLTSCNNLLDKRLTYKFNNKELKVLENKDSIFRDEYSFIRLFLDSVLIKEKGEEFLNKYTYREVFDFYHQKNKITKEILSIPNLKSEWLNEYGKIEEKFKKDSIYYTNYLKENDHRQYVDFEFLSADNTKERIYNRISVKIKIKPVNNAFIRKCDVWIYINEKTNTEDLNVFLPAAFVFFSGATSTEKIITGYENSSNDRNLREIIGLPVDIILQKYKIEFAPTELIANEKYIDVAFEKVPHSFRELLKNPKLFDKNYYIFKEIDKNYRDLYQFANLKTREKLYPKYKEFYDMHDLAFKKMYGEETIKFF